MKKYKVFHHIRILRGNFSNFGRKSFGRFAKIEIWASRRTFWGQTTFEKRYMFFLIVFGLRGNFLRTLKGTLQYGCPHCSLFVQGRSMSRSFFWHFWIFSEKFGIFGKTNFQQSCHICNLDIQRNVLRKRNFFEGFNYQIFFVLLPKKKLAFWWKKRSVGLSILLFTCPGERFEE